MKKATKYIVLAAFAAAVGASMTSCSETDAEKDKGATPVIKYARPVDFDKSDLLLVAAPLGARVVFVGEGLGDVQQVWFNDQKARLNPTMVTSHTVIVDIPNLIPGEVTNIAKFITSDNITTEYPFNVLVPAPRVNSMSCEYAKAGDIVTIDGAYFADDPNVPLTVSFGDVPATIKSISQSQLEVEVPAGATEAPVIVTSIYGSGESSFHYLDTTGMMIDFDGLTGLGNHGWHNRPIENDGSGISGNYMVLGNGSTSLGAAGDWNDSDFSFEYWAGSWNTPTDYPEDGKRLFDFVDFRDFNNKCIKFEVCIPASNAWQAGAMQLIFAPTSMISMGNAGTDVYGNTVAGCNNTFFQGGLARGLWRPWTSSEAYHTDGQWVTVSYPLSDCVYDQDGKGASTFLASVEDFASFQMFVWAGGVEGVECTPLIKIDNIRVVKN